VLLLLYGIGEMLNFNWPYYLSLLIATGLCVYQQCLIRQRKPAESIQAFLNNNWFGMTVFIGLVGQYWL
jgi:4-hydroxybenzoate polyprenyltransferase